MRGQGLQPHAVRLLRVQGVRFEHPLPGLVGAAWSKWDDRCEARVCSRMRAASSLNTHFGDEWLAHSWNRVVCKRPGSSGPFSDTNTLRSLCTQGQQSQEPACPQGSINP